MLRITELTNMLDASNGKVNSLNKAKDKLTSEIKELTIEIDNLGGENCSFNFVIQNSVYFGVVVQQIFIIDNMNVCAD